MKKAFTIIEILVVFSIIAVFIGIAVPKYKGMQDQAAATQARLDMGRLQLALESYQKHSATGEFPPASTAVCADSLVGASPQVMASALYDPFGATETSEYNYILSDNGQYYALCSAGVDKTGTTAEVVDTGVVPRNGDDICLTNGALSPLLANGVTCTQASECYGGDCVAGSCVAVDHAVSYDGNDNTGGTPPRDSNTYLNGATVTVEGNTGSLVKTGYTFADWNTAADGSGTDRAAASTFTMGSADVTLYAKWTEITTYTVTYDGNSHTGGSVPTDEDQYEDGATVTVAGNTGSLVRTGYAFADWNTEANGSGIDRAAASTFTMGSANVTLYAKWTALSAPGAPTIGTATAGNAQASVAFTAPASNGGSAITSYTATSNPGSLTASGAGSPLTVTGLTNGTAYTFTVTATNAIGTSAPSSASNSVTPFTVPGAPTIGTATAGNSQATVTFTAPASNGGSAITSYTATSNPGGRTASGAASPLTVTGLTNYTGYTFTVTATNAAGTSAASAASNTVTPTCFVAGTKILLVDGRSVAIENIKPGDVVLGPNGAHNKVVRLIVMPKADYKICSFNDGPYFVTDNHPFMTQNGWKSINARAGHSENPELGISEIRIGDELATRGGTVRVDKIDAKIFRDIAVYNIQLDGTHEFYADGFLVHNPPGPPTCVAPS